MADRTPNIDLIFRNGLREFEVLPPPDVWDGINPVIRKVSPVRVYLRAAAITGFAVVSGMITWYFSRSIGSSFNGPAITLNQDSRPEGKYIRGRTPGNANSMIINAGIQTSEATVKENDAGITVPLSFTLPDASLYNRLDAKSNSSPGQNNRLLISSRDFRASTASHSLNEPSVIYQVPENENQTAPKKKWTVGAMVAPTYYSAFGLNNNDQANELAKSEKAAVSYSGGLSFAYNVSRRISLQMGVYYTSLNQEIDGVKSYSGFTRYNTLKGSDNFSVQTSNGTITSRNSDIFLAGSNPGTRVSSPFSSEVFDPGKAGLDYINSTISQNFNYLEIPFIVRYKFIDKTLGMNIAGGISYNQLLDNSAYAVSDGNKYFIGSTEGLYPVTLSSSLGVGMEYNLSRRFSINLEPTFRYFLTPISGQASSYIHPYTFAILSGIIWKF